MLAAEAVLLGDAREAEGLAGKAAAEDVELRDVGHRYGMDVAVRGFAEVGGVGLAAELVPVAGEDAPRARPLEGDPEPADAAEEIDEAQGGHLTPALSPERRGRRGGAVRRRVVVKSGRDRFHPVRGIFSSERLGRGGTRPYRTS